MGPVAVFGFARRQAESPPQKFFVGGEDLYCQKRGGQRIVVFCSYGNYERTLLSLLSNCRADLLPHSRTDLGRDCRATCTEQRRPR